MALLRIAPRLLLLVTTALALAGSANASAAPRIIAGSNVPITDHPYQVRVSIELGSATALCGGSIRDATHVVTAAHCVVQQEGVFFPTIVPPSSVTIGYGSADQEVLDSNPGNQVGVDQVSVKREYARDPNSSEFDVAVLTLSAPIPGTDSSRAIPFASIDQLNAGAATAFATGWGLTAEGGDSSQLLQGVGLPLRDDAACLETYGHVDQGGAYNPELMLCAGGTRNAGSGNPDTCQGDSGGPLAVDATPETAPPSPTDWRLVGITSFGQGCGRPDTPGVYAWVQSPLLRPFLEAATPPAPPTAPSAFPTISGTLRVGNTITCNAPAVSGADVTQYLWTVVEEGPSFTLVAASGDPTLDLPAESEGAFLVCDARYESEGGFAYTDTPGSEAVGPVLPAPSGSGGTGGGTGTVNPPADTTRPRARVRSVRCRRGRCVIRISASDTGGLVRSLSAKLSYKVKRCRTVGGRRRCRSVKKTKRLRSRRRGSGFTISTRLKRGKYTLSAVAIDTSGNRSRAARKTFRVR